MVRVGIASPYAMLFFPVTGHQGGHGYGSTVIKATVDVGYGLSSENRCRNEQYRRQSLQHAMLSRGLSEQHERQHKKTHKAEHRGDSARKKKTSLFEVDVLPMHHTLEDSSDRVAGNGPPQGLNKALSFGENVR